MIVDIYVVGKGNKHIANYLSRTLAKEYDSDGMNIFIFENIDFDRIPEKVLKSPRIRKRLDIRERKAHVGSEVFYAQPILRQARDKGDGDRAVH